MREVVARDDLIDRLEEDIKQYLVRLREHELTEEQAERETALIFVIVNLEEIGDVIDKNLMELAEKKIRGNHVFSAQGWREIADLHAKVVENLELAMGALASGDREVAEKVIRHKSIVNTMERQLRAAHIQRLLLPDAPPELLSREDNSDFRGRWESGLAKMAAIGLGKQAGAQVHQRGGHA